MRGKGLTMISSVMLVVLTSAAFGAGTFALFRDTETSTGNFFAAGILDLKVRNGDEFWRDGLKGTWILSKMMPGTTRFGSISFRNEGSIAGDHLEITCSYTIDEGDPIESDTNHHSTADEMAKQMIITYMYYYNHAYDIDCLNDPNDDWRVDDIDGDKKITLYDLKYDKDGNGLDSLPPCDMEVTTLEMTIKFNEGAGNDFQGDTLDVTMIFTLNQHENQ